MGSGRSGNTAPVPPEPPVSLIAGRYRVGPVIGRGAMGEVRTAHDERLQRDVAVKLLRPDLNVDTSARGRFEEEAQAAARITHPNAVTVFDTGEQDGAAYIIMECLPGRTLADEMAVGALAPDRAREVVVDVLGALGAAHELGILHRDIKPGNILLTADGRAKLADFGIAKTAEGLNHTMTGEVMGTPAYMAPERLEGKPATLQSDLYSIGVVLYEAVSGCRPFAADTPMAVVRAVCLAEITPLAELVPGIDPGLARTVAQAMHRHPEGRFESAADLQVALDPGGPNRRTTAPAEAGAPTTRISTDPATEVFAAAPMPPAIEDLEPPTTGSGDPATTRVRSSRPSPRPRSIAVAVVIALIVGLWFVQRDDSGTPSSATTTSTADDGSGLPPALDDALDDLEGAVQP